MHYYLFIEIIHKMVYKALLNIKVIWFRIHNIQHECQAMELIMKSISSISNPSTVSSFDLAKISV